MEGQYAHSFGNAAASAAPYLSQLMPGALARAVAGGAAGMAGKAIPPMANVFGTMPGEAFRENFNHYFSKQQLDPLNPIESTSPFANPLQPLLDAYGNQHSLADKALSRLGISPFSSSVYEDDPFASPPQDPYGILRHKADPHLLQKADFFNRQAR